ncbi:hypothetical protein EEB14_32930 [Rhodococcus sp. WS4]|nr:hypothetical protein EEB14_32930 [Rhodococcus sp. WS4]
MNLAHLLLRGTTYGGERPAWKYGSDTATYREMVDRVSQLAAGLTAAGLRPGDRIVLDLPNRPELLEMLWTCFWGGFVAVPLNWHLHASEVGYVVEDCGAAVVLVAKETADHAVGLPASVRVLSCDTSAGQPLTDVLGVSGLPPRDTRPDDPAWLFYTSGTTGRPKGAVLSHRNLLSMTLNYYSDVDPVSPGSVYLHAAPLSHGSGLYLLPATGHGATNVIMSSTSFDADSYLDLVAAERVSHAAFLAPTMLNRVVAVARPRDPRLATLRSIVIGGAPFYREDVLRARDRLGPIVHQIYGQGEAPMTITALRADEWTQARLPSCGRPFSGVEVRVVDAAGRDVTVGESGEVAVRGDVVMSGYWNNPSATAQALRNGLLHTGDIGHFDEHGFLYLTDRAKDVIITGGSNVYPREVEEVLLTHPAVSEVAVVGLPDPAWGESICAVVVTVQDATVSKEELVEYCRDHLASFKKPREVVFVAELPKNATGKVLKRGLRDLDPRSH